MDRKALGAGWSSNDEMDGMAWKEGPVLAFGDTIGLCVPDWKIPEGGGAQSLRRLLHSACGIPNAMEDRVEDGVFLYKGSWFSQIDFMSQKMYTIHSLVV